MNKYEMIPMTYPELKVLRALVEGGRDMLLVNGSKATLEPNSASSVRKCTQECAPVKTRRKSSEK